MKLSQQFAVRERTTPDPAPAFKFWVELNNIVTAEFKECSGLRMERQVKTYQEGGCNGFVHIFPGPVKYANIVFKYGVGHSMDLLKWYVQGLQTGQVAYKDLSILLRNVQGDVVRRWNIHKAFPVKWEGPQMNTESNQVAIETFEIAHHGIRLDLNGQ